MALKTRTRHWVQILIGIVALGVGGFVIYGERAQLSGTSHAIATATLWLVVAGFGLEVLSDISYALMTYYLIPRALTRLTRRWFFGVSLAALAMNDTIPLGAGFSVLYVYRKLRGRGCSVLEATAALLAGNLIAIIALLVLMAIAVLARTQATSVLSNFDIAILLVLLLVAALAVVRIDRVLGLVIAFGLWARTTLHLPVKVDPTTRHVVPQLRFSSRSLAQSALGALGNWLFDFTALLLSLAAVHAHVGLMGVMASYTLGALAANLPITPGGLGVVEGSITVALVAFGGAPSAMLAAVLLYRVVSYWAWIPIGWISYFLLGGLHEGRT